jgi:SAM-dependent methyltransferase
MSSVDSSSVELKPEFEAGLNGTRSFFDRLAPARASWIEKNRYFYESDWAYHRFLIPEGARVLEIGCGIGDLLAELKPSRGVGLDLSANMVDIARQRHPQLSFVVGDAEDPETLDKLEGPFDAIVISDTIGLVQDLDRLLANLHRLCVPETRIVISYYSRLWEPVLKAAERFGLMGPKPPQSWLATDDTINMLTLAGFETIKREWRLVVPKRLFGLGPLFNRTIGPLPGLRRLSLRSYVVARPVAPPKAPVNPPSVSIVIPCRNEKGNIEAAIQRLPAFAPDMEVLYVEGHSADGTFEECLRVQAAYPNHDIKVMRQDGKGKADAVWKGFNAARGDILMILDADLTVPPETLPKFYAPIATGKAEFVNGTRLVYPMDDEAMRLLNWIANRGFARLFSYLLNQRFTDTLCGTKVIRKNDYLRLVRNRSYFGNFDPFGDFDLIFGASKLNLRIVEVPIRYAARSYGETQIQRFRHGLILLRMVLFAWRKLKAI